MLSLNLCKFFFFFSKYESVFRRLVSKLFKTTVHFIHSFLLHPFLRRICLLLYEPPLFKNPKIVKWAQFQQETEDWKKFWVHSTLNAFMSEDQGQLDSSWYDPFKQVHKHRQTLCCYRACCIWKQFPFTHFSSDIPLPLCRSTHTLSLPLMDFLILCSFS